MVRIEKRTCCVGFERKNNDRSISLAASKNHSLDSIVVKGYTLLCIITEELAGLYNRCAIWNVITAMRKKRRIREERNGAEFE